MVRRSLWLSLTLLAGLASAEPFVILRGDSLGRDDAVTYAKRIAACLDEVGVASRTISDQNVTAETLGDAKVAVLPYNKPDSTTVHELALFAQRGGRILAFFTTGAPRLLDLLGLSVGPLVQADYDGELAAIEPTQAARQEYPGLPERIHQGSWHRFTLVPHEGTRVFAVWGKHPLERRPAVTENAAGWYVGHVLMSGDLPAKGQFLLALAARAEPALWRPVLQRRYERALAGIERARSRWERVQGRPEFGTDRRAELAPRVMSLVARAGLLPPPTDGTAAGSLLRLYHDTTEEATGLAARLAISPAHELRGLWVFKGGPIDWVELASRCRDAGLNAIFYRVSRGGSAVYPSRILPQQAGFGGRDEVATAIAACRRYGLEFHAWRVCFHLGSAPEAYRARLKRDGRLCQSADGSTEDFANPGDPRNQELERKAVQELLDRYDVDGIHLDYIRYPYHDNPAKECDYGPVSKRAFERRLGQTVDDWPNAVVRGPLKTDYEDWMRGNIDGLVRDLASEVRTKPGVVLSAAVWRRHRKYRYAIRQDWPLWLRRHWLDLVVPMDYVEDPEDLAEDAAEQVPQTRGEGRIALGLGAWKLDQPEQLGAQIDACREAGADGFVLFSNNAPQLSEQFAALPLGRTSRRAEPTTRGPSLRWKLPQALARKDAPPAFLAGRQAAVELRLGPRWGTYRGEVAGMVGQVDLEDPATGEQVETLGKLAALGGPQASFTGAFTVVERTLQLVVRGHCTPPEGEPWAFEARGPLVTGVSSEDWNAYAARLKPPVLNQTGLKIGVWHDGIGSDAILAALGAREGVVAAPLYQFKLDHLRQFEAVVIPQLLDVGDLNDHSLSALRQWVDTGGRLLLTHDAVGYRWHPTPFPEVGVGIARVVGRTVVATPSYRTAPAGWEFEQVYGDHIAIQRSPTGFTVFQDTKGKAVVVMGRFGQGLVILDGMLTGATGGAEAMPERSVDLLLQLLRWRFGGG